MRSLVDRFVVLGVSGGIAAYKAAEVTRLLVKAGARVQVVMTEAATRFVGEMTFAALSGRPTMRDMFDLGSEARMGHIELAESADLLLVAPATADLIARMAAGMADDLLAAIALVTRAPILLAPAMNVHMWEHPLTQANLERLRLTGRLHLVGPAEGSLACGETGAGRLAEPEHIVAAAAALLEKKDLASRTLLVTAGPTREALDPVRYLGNRSTGRMGYEIAAAAAARGARVILVSGPTTLEPPLGAEIVRVETALEMAAAVESRFDAADAIVMCAAVADYRPERIADQKIKKKTLGESPTLRLVPNPDILATLGARRRERGRGPLLVGFAAETGEIVDEARRKLRDKGCDLVVANEVGVPDSGFASETNRAILVGPGDACERLPLLPKRDLAHLVLDRIAKMLSDRTVGFANSATGTGEKRDG